MVGQDNHFIGIPWKFNGRDKNSGVDCIGLLVEFYKVHQWHPSFDDGKLIDREWFVREKYRMLRYFIKNFEKTRSIAALEYGDIVLFEVYGEHHTGIYLEYDKFLSTFPPENATVTSYSFIDRLSYWGQFFVCGFKRRKAGE